MNTSAGQQAVDDLFTDEVFYEPASTGQRFINFLIDNLLMRFALSWVSGTVMGLLLAALAPDYAIRLGDEGHTGDLLLIAYLVTMFNYFIYYSICEKAFRGYTLGKLVTGTRAVRSDGKELRFKDALLRTLCRLVPFEPFSGLGRQPWHDQWTRTQVINVR